MSEVGELRHLLTTTTSALSAAQRNVGQERDARQVGSRHVWVCRHEPDSMGIGRVRSRGAELRTSRSQAAMEQPGDQTTAWARAAARRRPRRLMLQLHARWLPGFAPARLRLPKTTFFADLCAAYLVVPHLKSPFCP